MKIPLRLPCGECDAITEVWIQLEDSEVEFTGDCGHFNSGSISSLPIGDLVFRRATHSFTREKDYSMCIVFAAMALECRLSELHDKWELLKAYDSPSYSGDDPPLESMLRRYLGIREKIEGVARLMHPGGIEEFVAANRHLREKIEHDFPSLRLGSIARDIQRTIFWPRNEILHRGKTKDRKEDARRAHNVAALGMLIFTELDRRKREQGARVNGLSPGRDPGEAGL